MSRLPGLARFAGQHGLLLTSIEKLKAYATARKAGTR